MIFYWHALYLIATQTVNSSTMFGYNIGFISTSNLSVPRIFNVPNLSYNLFSVGHNIETCYQHNKSIVSISATTITNTKSIQPIAPIFAKSKSSGPIITISTVDLWNIITNTIHMVGNASYSSSLSVLSGMSPSSWLMDSTCYNHMTPHSSLFFQLEPAPHSLNIRTANSSTMFGYNIGFISTSNLSVPRIFNIPNLSYNLFFMRQLV